MGRSSHRNQGGEENAAFLKHEPARLCRLTKMCLQSEAERRRLLRSRSILAIESATIMAHIVTSKCVGCKFTDCVEVCPVACFYELDSQLVIHPEDCIDCTACVAECPVEAIYAEEAVPADYQVNIEFNATEAHRVKDSGQSAIV